MAHSGTTHVPQVPLKKKFANFSFANFSIKKFHLFQSMYKITIHVAFLFFIFIF